MKKRLITAAALLIPVSLAGCGPEMKTEEKPMSQTYQALYSNDPVIVDGQLNEPVWQQAPCYPMYLSQDKTDEGQVLREGGQIRFAWDDDYFYLGADFIDSDLVAQGEADELHHYQLGDVCELFLKPVEETYYWELYVTPAGHKSSFFIPARSYLGLPDCLEKYTSGLKAAAQCRGTLNRWQDRDSGWTAEMAMPIRDLEAFGAHFGPGRKWTVLVGRYNYSRYLPEKELSMSPPLSATFFHLYEEYAELELIR